jgi:predicted alpha/beta superfamily hydrolase
MAGVLAAAGALLAYDRLQDKPAVSRAEAKPIANAAMPAHEPQIPAARTQIGGGRSYQLLGTEVWDVLDPISGRVYQVYVSLPASYEKSPNRRYPVLFATDAGYAFPIVREIARRVNLEGPKVEEFILVGLSYANGEDGTRSRNRDYTPTVNGPRSAPAGSVHGQGRAYQTYLRDRVKPFIAQRYRTDPRKAVFLGHSYGGLLGAQILFTDPTMFSDYLLGSPSFWFDKRHIFAKEAAYASGHRDLPANVYMYVGEFESPRFNRINEMVGDNREFDRILKSRAYPNLHIKSEVLDDEDHVTVAPRGFTRGLLYLLPATGR